MKNTSKGRSGKSCRNSLVPQSAARGENREEQTPIRLSHPSPARATFPGGAESATALPSPRSTGEIASETLDVTYLRV